MSTIPVLTKQTKGALVNSPALRRAITFVLALLVVVSCFFSYISYPVPVYQGYDNAAAVKDAEAAYKNDLDTYNGNVKLRDATKISINEVLQPQYDAAVDALEIRQQSAGPGDDITELQTAVDTAKAALTEARKVMSGLQNLIAPVPVQDPVPADAKLIKYADDLLAGKEAAPPMTVSDASLVDTAEEVIADHNVSGFAVMGRSLTAANALGAIWTLIPGVALIGILAVLTLLNVPEKFRKPMALLGVLLFCFSALRIETAGAKELGAIAKSYSFGSGYSIGLIASILLLFSVLFEGKNLDFTWKNVKRFSSDKAIYLVLLVLVGAIAAVNPRFLTTNTFINIVQQSSTRLIIAMGMSFVIIGTGGVDLSACRVVGMTAVISASMLQNADYSRIFFPNLPQLPVILPFLLAVFVALLFGLVNGVIVAKLNVPPFIATLATMVIVYGANSIYFNLPPNNSQPIGGLRDDFTYLGTGKIYGFVPIIVIIALVVCFLVWFLQNKTVFGKNVYAIGGNREAAKVSGINVPITVIIIFALAAALIGMAGVLEAARTGGATNNYGVGYELDAIAACVVGGVSSSGGVGTVGGVVSGVFIFQVINYGLTFIGVDPYWQQIIKGLIIASAVALDIRKYVNKK